MFATGYTLRIGRERLPGLMLVNAVIKLPGGALLTGPTKCTPVGRIRRLRRHPASEALFLR
ncbi:hypothetical protein CKO_03822 [Citrobacter koseri ATCC BAA-895]|uniref:Uncharacterized protein n=1 Tax=Citrobacter koseri (strain ATCC BAA-895 / CDC 4225-83 / SGSC4696) TaxID=290338 RepID=A8AN35_CITK8|nr:hypothetical protein CKO_03822 [Citrobacter koseri ATCC BAA-895]